MRLRTPDWLLARPIAHRGLHDAERPENSVAAYDAAIAAGYPIELDVHLGSGGELVVFHDRELARMTGAEGWVDRVPWSTLSGLRLGGSDEAIPTLQQVLARVAGRVPVVVELKPSERASALCRAVLDALVDYRGAIAIQSFDPRLLARLRAASWRGPLGVLASDFADQDMGKTRKLVLRNLLLAPASLPSYIGYQLRCLPHPAATLARRLGCAIVAWTIRTEAELARAAELADNVIFEEIRP
ncbi:MAG: glycerophosphodiester phosphodiesterase [Deltaproteobacteria bacterium]|nr:glycerophosphodiester phosphodiesterase [Nannocystaceae bacterium]